MFTMTFLNLHKFSDGRDQVLNKRLGNSFEHYYFPRAALNLTGALNFLWYLLTTKEEDFS